MKIVILYSGGLDSRIMLEVAKQEHSNDEIICVYFDIGHDYAFKEKQVLPDFVHVYDMRWFQAKGEDKTDNSMGSIFIPGRNLLFATLAACKFVPNEVWLGSLLGENHIFATDKNEQFRKLASDTLSYTLSPFIQNVKVSYPLIEKGWDKLAATEWALKNGLKDDIITSSSCMTATSLPCGSRCGVCLRRWGIFTQLGIEEVYEEHPLSGRENIEMCIKLIDDELDSVTSEQEKHYNIHRRREILPTLQQFFGTQDFRAIKTALTVELNNA